MRRAAAVVALLVAVAVPGRVDAASRDCTTATVNGVTQPNWGWSYCATQDRRTPVGQTHRVRLTCRNGDTVVYRLGPWTGAGRLSEADCPLLLLRLPSRSDLELKRGCAMATANSRTVLDWLRSWWQAKAVAIGDTFTSSNMNIPLTSNARITAAIGWLTDREAVILANWTPEMEAAWDAIDDEIWPSILAEMPSNVATLWAGLWTDADANVKLLLKTLMRVMCLSVIFHRFGGNG